MEKISTTASPWKDYQKITFRFVFIFFILFIILLDWSVNPIFSYLYYYGGLSTGLDMVTSWVGKGLFDIQYIIISPYDGEHNDRTYVYLLYFTIAIVAIAGTIIWSLLDRKRKNYDLLYYWFTTIIRYYLAFTLFLFALEKFFKMQFPDLGYYTLTEPVGDMSPMHLAWAFFGYSYGYNIFIGLAESAGLFLLFRRTTTFGAILTMGTLANVMAVNYNYGVHAKMYPTVLFFMALFLILRDARSLVRFFFTNQTVSLPDINAPEFQKKWMNTSKIVLKFLVIGIFLLVPLMDYIGYKNQSEESLIAKSKYSGVYHVDLFVMNNDTLPKDNPFRWEQLVIGEGTVDAVRLKGDSVVLASVAPEKKELIVSGNLTDFHTKRQEVYNELGMSDNTYYAMDSILIARQMVSRLHFELSDSTTLRLKGTIKNDSINVTAKRGLKDVSDFRLMKRRFLWVNEAVDFY